MPSTKTISLQLILRVVGEIEYASFSKYEGRKARRAWGVFAGASNAVLIGHEAVRTALLLEELVQRLLHET